MNPETAREDVINLDPGAAVLYDEPLNLKALRSDVHFYAAPFDKLVAPLAPPKFRKLVRNIIYDGVLAYLLGIELEEVRKALFKQFASKLKAAEMNWAAAQAGFSWAQENLEKADPFPLGADERKPGQDHYRRQRRGGSGRGVRRRGRHQLVSDHAVVVAGGSGAGLSEAVPHRQAKRQGHVRRHPGGRTSSLRSAWPSAPAGRARGR